MKRKADTKARIVKAAWELFYEQGYDSTTVDDIVELSGTSKGSFYHYFESKDAVLSSLAYLFDQRYEELEAGLDPKRGAFGTLLYLNRELFDLIDRKIDRDLISRLYSTQLNGHSEKSLLDDSRLYYRLLRRIVSAGQSSGELTETLSINDIVRLYAMCERAMIYEWCLCGFTFSLRAYSEQMLPMLLNGIRAAGADDADR